MESRSSPGRSSYTGSQPASPSAPTGGVARTSPSHRYPTQMRTVSRPSRTSSLVRQRPSTPLNCSDLRSATASIQPHRRGLPVVAPTSAPRSPRRRPSSSRSSVGKGAGTDPGRVRLGDPEHVVDPVRARAASGGGDPRRRIGRGDVGVGPVVDIEKAPLRALRRGCSRPPSRAGEAARRRRRRAGRTITSAAPRASSHTASAETGSAP